MKKAYLNSKNIKAPLLDVQDEVTFVLPVGVEIEMCVFDRYHQPVDLTSKRDFLKRMAVETNLYGVYIEAATNMLEIDLKPVRTLSSYVSSLLSVFDFLEKQPESSAWWYVFGDNKSRVRVNHSSRSKALRHVCGKNIINQCRKYTSFQVSFGVQEIGGPFSKSAKKLLYMLNNLALPMAMYFESLSGVNSQRLRYVFTQFTCDPIRLPHPVTYAYINALENHLLEIPYLIIEEPSGSQYWRLAEDQKPSLLSAMHCKQLWWFARLNGLGVPSEERIEWRPMTSISPGHSIQILKLLNQLVHFILIAEIEPIDDETWWRFRYGGLDDRQQAIVLMQGIFNQIRLNKLIPIALYYSAKNSL